MWEAIYNQIEEWSNGLMNELMEQKPAYAQDLDEERVTDFQGEDLLTLSRPEDSIFRDSVTGDVDAVVLDDVAEVSEPTVRTSNTTDEAFVALNAVEDVMPSDGFLTEVSQVESKLGQHEDTYRDNYHGGMMQVDKIGYEDTKDTKSHPKLKAKHDLIEKEFGIKWQDTSWEDLRDPLHSAIAARLKLSNVKEAIPETMEDRAAYWKKYYNTSEGKGSVEHYMSQFL